MADGAVSSFLGRHPRVSRFFAEHQTVSRFVFNIAHHVSVIERYVPAAPLALVQPAQPPVLKPRGPFITLGL